LKSQQQSNEYPIINCAAVKAYNLSYFDCQLVLLVEIIAPQLLSVIKEQGWNWKVKWVVMGMSLCFLFVVVPLHHSSGFLSQPAKMCSVKPGNSPYNSCLLTFNASVIGHRKLSD